MLRDGGHGHSNLEESLSVTEWRPVSGCGLLVQVLAGEDLLDEDSGDCGHGSTSVVELGVLLADLLAWLLLPVVDLSESDTVVSVELGCWPPGELDESCDEDDLGESGGWDLEESSDTAVDVGELDVVGWGKVSIEGPLVVVDESSEHGHHGDASVLALDGTTALEGLWLSLQPSKWIEDTEWLSDTKLELADLEGRGGLGRLGWGECGGGTGEEGGDGELHFDGVDG
mmetsp:Transcript_21347/g.59345  ORF Transcript_21347/g.59345 Transcript_21347/m.59345 type:complete len:228 (-) Transcript_21347:59-742(-)